MDENKACDCPICGGKFTPEEGQSADEYIVKGILTAYKEMQNKSVGESLPCPRCGCIRDDGDSTPSKHANVLICADCAAAEASKAKPLPLMEWQLVSELLNLYKRSGTE